MARHNSPVRIDGQERADWLCESVEFPQVEAKLAAKCYHGKGARLRRWEARVAAAPEDSAMRKLDVYGLTHELDPATVDAIATRLEARRDSPAYMRLLHDYLDEIDLGTARDVLALGAGTGVEVRELARRPDFPGNATAIDISGRLVEIGRRRAEEEGVADRITWRIGDAQALDFPDESFDLVTAHTLISHVKDPVRVLEEARRVLRPGGTLAVFDGDYATLTFGTENAEEGRAWDERIIGTVVANPRVMRSLPRMLQKLRLALVVARAHAFNEIGKADFFLGALQSFRIFLPKAGAATAAEVEAFVADQLLASEEGAFFAGYNFVTYIARRPE
jgi:ubiquinone/menaquinone biosynthesis C-methylase UbiE